MTPQELSKHEDNLALGFTKPMETLWGPLGSIGSALLLSSSSSSFFPLESLTNSMSSVVGPFSQESISFFSLGQQSETFNHTPIEHKFNPPPAKKQSWNSMYLEATKSPGESAKTADVPSNVESNGKNDGQLAVRLDQKTLSSKDCLDLLVRSDMQDHILGSKVLESLELTGPENNKASYLDSNAIVHQMMPVDRFTFFMGNAIPFFVPLKPNQQTEKSKTTMAPSEKNTKPSSPPAAHITPQVTQKRTRRQDPDPAFRKYITPNPMDVKCGRGGESTNNPGNKYYLANKAALQVEYRDPKTTSARKKEICRDLLNLVKSRNGRFIKKDKVGWYEITGRAAWDKACQALRDLNTEESRREKRVKYGK